MVRKTVKETVGKVLPKTIAILFVASIVALALSAFANFIIGLIPDIAGIGVILVSTILTLTIFGFAIKMKGAKKFDTLTEIIPLLIVAPLVSALVGLVGLDILIVGVDSTLPILALVIASTIFAVSLLRQTGIKMFK